MKTIIAGSRNLTPNISKIIQESGFDITEVVCGMARGVDMAGYLWAKQNKIPIQEYPADWLTYGKSAGFLRNKAMADYADALIAIWDGYSKGTKHMIDLATGKKLKVFVYLDNTV